MNPTVKALWVRALRSGNYRQGVGGLADPGMGTEIRYCCLGVLCDLAVKAGVITMRASSNGHFLFGQFGQDARADYSETQLPQAVQKWAGLNSGNPTLHSIPDPEREGAIFYMPSLVDLNDGCLNSDKDERRRLTFDQIADVIEAQL